MTNIRNSTLFAPYIFTNCTSVQANISRIKSVQIKTNMTYSDSLCLYSVYNTVVKWKITGHL